MDLDVIRLNASAQDHVAAYLEYNAIVGNADGGVMMSEAEYAAFKARMIEARKNRLYVCWRDTETGIDCKNIGPQSKCFCQVLLLVVWTFGEHVCQLLMLALQQCNCLSGVF